jgi:hypothetical protein
LFATHPERCFRLVAPAPGELRLIRRERARDRLYSYRLLRPRLISRIWADLARAGLTLDDAPEEWLCAVWKYWMTWYEPHPSGPPFPELDVKGL